MEELNAKKLSGESLQGKELYDLKKRQREAEKNNENRIKELPRKSKKYALYFLLAAISIALVGGVAWFIITSPKLPNLPPTTTQGHTEDMPQTHITDSPIPDSMQRHMLEHADGKGKPGILIQYNCKKYSCEADLVQKLTDLVKQYPDNVYLAPNNYDGKIILTKLGKLKILEEFDERAIKNFYEPR